MLIVRVHYPEKNFALSVVALTSPRTFTLYAPTLPFELGLRVDLRQTRQEF